MPAKKYISIINKGGNNIYIKDAEAREALSLYEDVYIGVGSTAESVMVAANHHDTMSKGDHVSMTASSNKVWIILPNTFSPVLTMTGVEMPMTPKSDITEGGVTYKVFSSTNTYTGTFNVFLF